MPNDGSKKELVFTIVWLFIVMIIVTMGLLVYNAQENTFNLEKFYFYGIILISMIIIIVAVKIIETKHLDVIIHKPDESFLNKFPILDKFISNPLILALFFITIFMFVGFIIVAKPQTALAQFIGQTSLPSYHQQIAPTGNVILDVEPASTAETLLLVVFLSFLYYGLMYFFKGDETTSLVLKVILPFVGGLSWMLYHTARYGNSDVALQSTFIFGLISSALLFIFMSAIPALIYHGIGNNLFLSIKENFGGSDITKIIIIILGLIFLGLTIYVYSKEDD